MGIQEKCWRAVLWRSYQLLGEEKGVQVRVLAQVLAGWFVSVFPKGPACRTCASTPVSTPSLLPASVPATPPPALFCNSHFVFYFLPGHRDFKSRAKSQPKISKPYLRTLPHADETQALIWSSLPLVTQRWPFTLRWACGAELRKWLQWFLLPAVAGTILSKHEVRKLGIFQVASNGGNRGAEEERKHVEKTQTARVERRNLC